MLEGLDAIDWSSLTHAHGPASDVPERLRSLLFDDPAVQLEACAELHERIRHQGTVYPASAAAVPFLFELLAHPVGRVAGCAASLLGCIATGEGWLQYGLRALGKPHMEARLAGQGLTVEEALEQERAVMVAIHQGVSASVRSLLSFLRDREGLAPLVAEALGCFPEHASWLLPAIDAELALQSDDHVRQVLAESRARLTSRRDGPGRP
jgi:hypothetical protein